MRRDETVKVLLTLQRAYPLFYSNKTQKDVSAIAELWHKHIGCFEFEVIDKAVEMMINAETSVPTIALLRKYIPYAEEEIKRERSIKMQNSDTLNKLAR